MEALKSNFQPRRHLKIFKNSGSEHEQNEKTARKISFWKINFSNGILEHMSERYLFSTGEKKIACAVRCRVYCAWAVVSSRKLGLGIFLLLKHFFCQNLLKICRFCNKIYPRNPWNTLLIQFPHISHNFPGKVVNQQI